jgi:hypothetical protein
MSDTPLTQHPLSAVFPAMTDVAFAEFRADIAQNGLQQPIIVFEDQILEGWHRYRACRDTGTPARFEHFDGDEVAARTFVVTANVKRRHLNESQRGLIAARMAQLPHGGDRKSDQRTNSSLDVAGAAELRWLGPPKRQQPAPVAKSQPPRSFPQTSGADNNRPLPLRPARKRRSRMRIVALRAARRLVSPRRLR